MASVRPINVTIKGDYTDADVKRAIKDLQTLQKQAPATAKKTDQLSASTQKLGYSWKQAAVGIAAATVSIGAIGRAISGSINAASAMAESQSKVRVVFGQSATQIEDWAKTASTSMLMTQQSALEAAGTYGNLFQAFGIGRKAATEMSTTLVDLAADLASFNNTSVEDAIVAIRSGLSGEMEPMKRYGAALTDARLRQEALNLGIYNGKGILDAAQKSQAAYALILKDTALAQGDVERTADGYANTMRAVEAAVGDAQAKIGQELLMGIQEVSKSLGGSKGLVSLIDELAESFVDILRPARDFFSVISDGNQEIKNATGFSLDFANSLRNGLGFILGPTAGLLTRYADSAQEADEKSQSMSRTFVVARDNFLGLAYAAGLIDENMKRVDDSADDATDSLRKQKSAVDQLRDSLDKLNGKNRSVTANRIALRGLRRDGPAQSGEREVKDAEGKVTTKRFSTRDDRLSFGLDYAAQVEELAQSLADRPGGADDARRVLNKGRRFLAGQLGREFADENLSTPAYLDRGNKSQRTAGKRYEGMGGDTYITIERVEVSGNTPAEQVESIKRWNRQRALSNSGANAALVN